MMRKNPFLGKLIVFDGLDGSGLTTQANLLVKKINKNLGKKAFLLKEPTSSLIGGLIRSWLSNDWRSSQECLQLLFAADRAYHLEKEIIPLLRKGKIVILDRYIFSSLAFGGIELEEEWLREINRNFLLPDLTFFLKVSPKNCIKRIKETRYELRLFEKEEILKKVWKNFENLSKEFKNVFIVDGERDREEILREIFNIFLKYLK